MKKIAFSIFLPLFLTILVSSIHQSDHPMKKYRGGDINEFFKKKVSEEVEECLVC